MDYILDKQGIHCICWGVSLRGDRVHPWLLYALCIVKRGESICGGGKEPGGLLRPHLPSYPPRNSWENPSSHPGVLWQYQATCWCLPEGVSGLSSSFCFWTFHGSGNILATVLPSDCKSYDKKTFMSKQRNNYNLIDHGCWLVALSIWWKYRQW